MHSKFVFHNILLDMRN